MEIENQYISYSKKPEFPSKKITELTFEYTRNDYYTDENGHPYRAPTLHTRFREVQSASHNKRTINFIIDLIVILATTYLFVCFLKYILHNLNSKAEISFVWLLSFPIFFLLYYVVLEFKFQRTLGKFFTNTLVIDEYAQNPSLNQIFWRTIYRIPRVNYLNFYYTEYLGGSNYCRGLHDRNTNTWVVPMEEYENLKKLLKEQSIQTEITFGNII